ncbi:uncharacterized protein KD926_001331 [Aspergillus affinis]|uniref:uncharacterized protein n=1 Tax=Aspergillus affinis TaxID=1070780 RepID=UPI0022FEF602|nr:uncharacterized protein KD926_001331 [Aspergillus affinis]KAI9036753.1 hypothetical protein KD926_001331 [Aspergillus affinis]
MASDHDQVRAGFVVAISEEESKESEQRVLLIKQLENVYSLPDDVSVRPEAFPPIHWGFGPVRVNGYVNPSKLSIRVEVSVFGAKLVNITADLKRGVCAKINLKLANGSICFNLKNGKEVWVKLQLHVKFDGNFNKEEKLLTI